MKVCTDSCLFGAWVAEKALQAPPRAVLDIGSGTGLLTQMLAQKIPSEFLGIEIDEAACRQSTENCSGTPWQNKIRFICADVTKYNFETQFDLIISNPPFYEAQLPSPARGRAVAHHSAALSHAELLDIIDRNLSAEGQAALLLSYYAADGLLEKGLPIGFSAETRLNVSHSAAHRPTRSFLWLTRGAKCTANSTMVIKKADGEYSDEARRLLKDYYPAF